MALVQQARLGVPTPASPRTLSRFETVQSLMTFVQLIESLPCKDSTYHLCLKMRDLVNRVLRSLLDSPPQTAADAQPVTSSVDFDFQFEEVLNWTGAPWTEIFGSGLDPVEI